MASANSETVNHFFMRKPPAREPSDVVLLFHVPEATFSHHDFRHMARRAGQWHGAFMVSRRSLFLGFAALAACRAEPRASLEATDSVDPAFTACSQSCGLHGARERKLARSQPGVNEGDVTFCPVSGAVFRVSAETPRRTARGKLLYFCCEACAGFFARNEAMVLERRGLS
jgi:YHS domain-containing protein